MRKKRLKIFLLVALCAVLALSVLLTACNNDGKKTTKASDTLYVGTVAVIEKATRDEYNFDVMSTNITQLPLVGINERGEYYPAAATWTVNEDGSVWTYTVREGLKWHDGTPVTADDILATLYYSERNNETVLLTPTLDANGKPMERYKSAVVSDDKRSITLTLAQPNVRELGNMTTMRLVPAAVYGGNKTVDDDMAVSEADSRLGCGPFEFESFNKAAGTLTFKSYDDYFGGAPNVKRITFRLFGNEDTMYRALAEGNLDTTWKYSGGLSSAAQTMLAGKENITLFSAVAKNNPAVLMFNNSKAPFNNENLRLAVRYALDYAQFRTLFASEYAAPSRAGMVPSVVYGYADTEVLERNFVKAEEYMKAAGYTAKDGQGYWIKDDKRMSFSLTYNAENALHMRYAEMVRNNLADFGIEVKLDACEKATYQAKTTNKFGNNNPVHEAAIIGFTAAGMDMMGGLSSIYIYGGHGVQGGAQVFDKEFEGIYNDLQSASAEAQYFDAAKRCQEYYAEHAPAIALYWDSYVYARDNRVSGFVVDANFGLFSLETWASITIK